MIKKFVYFLFLANIPKNLWTLIIGTPFYLSNWRMRYSRMTWKLALSCKVLGVLSLQNKIQIACSLNDIQIPTKVIHDLTWQNLPYMPLTLCWVWSGSKTPVERCFMLPRSKLTYMPQINSYSYTGNTLKHVFHHYQNKYSMLSNMISLAYF
jgi:hypothetical protein